MSEVVAEYENFLNDYLPRDYDEHEEEYRGDEQFRRKFQIDCFENGWVAPTWPKELGGRELTLLDSIAVALTGAERLAPRNLNLQGTGVVAPGIKKFGTEEQKDKYLVPTLRGEAWWALGMSEPEAGSDLASLRTLAVQEDEKYRINGQKIWTTQADEAKWCLLYARTDPSAPKHKGLSCFLLDMDAPGITQRPIPTAGHTIDSFSELFFDDVVVDQSQMLGKPGQGWQIAIDALNHERDMIWVNNWLELKRALKPLLTTQDLNNAQKVELGRLQAILESIRLTGIRSVIDRVSGGPGEVSMILKLLGSESVQNATDLSLRVNSQNGIAAYREFHEYLESLAATIYGGTSEIQKNIIAERILGLPKGA